ncbi:hypothetical protein ABVK25_006789 [Lepraria finkii]|uniref:Acetate kinase n=1 Tax=Lepraria finkii TaxID=1340010 RepID=A0ABR4B4Q2_9LECA
MAIILSINSGSSSVKVSVYKSSAQGQPPQQLADAQLKVKDVKSNEDACEYILNHLVKDKELSEISSREDITHACHCVAHGGDYLGVHVIGEETHRQLEDLTDLAPLHNTSVLATVKACIRALPKANNIAYFDSSFHATIPEAIRTYPIDPAVAKKNKPRKYGFHGISYAFVTRSVVEYLKKPESETSIIALHLGSGASACAIKNGKSLDNSMGLTPLRVCPARREVEMLIRGVTPLQTYPPPQLTDV